MTPPASAVAPPATVRCAIYTRKSTEEGLDQAFTSLDAQREAALAYVHSQQHAGWIALPECYDDGGYSGGTMDRPALAQLLHDRRLPGTKCRCEPPKSLRIVFTASVRSKTVFGKRAMFP